MTLPLFRRIQMITQETHATGRDFPCITPSRGEFEKMLIEMWIEFIDIRNLRNLGHKLNSPQSEIERVYSYGGKLFNLCCRFKKLCIHYCRQYVSSIWALWAQWKVEVADHRARAALNEYLQPNGKAALPQQISPISEYLRSWEEFAETAAKPGTLLMLTGILSLILKNTDEFCLIFYTQISSYSRKVWWIHRYIFYASYSCILKSFPKTESNREVFSFPLLLLSFAIFQAESLTSC